MLFNTAVFFLTLSKVSVLLCFLAIGYLLVRTGTILKNASRCVSVLCTYLFCPAYNIINLPGAFTPENLRSNTLLIASGAALLAASLLLSNFLAKKLSRGDFEKKSLTYIFTFANYGFFGYPVIQGVFGDAFLARFIIFCIPINIVAISYGYGIFAGTKKFDWKKTVLSPVVISSVLGCAIGYFGLSFPDFLSETLSIAAGCMSPAAMLTAGMVLGSFSLLDLIFHFRPYLYSLIRLLILPLLGGAILFLLGVRGEIFTFSTAFLAMPVGLNCVVFPESFGLDSSQNAKTCFVSFILSLLTLPAIFSVMEAVGKL